MRKIRFGQTFAVLVVGCCAMVGGMARTAPMEVVTVEVARSQKVAQTRYGVPVREITIASSVSYADLDLATPQGAKELEKRIRETATSSCKEMDVKFPVEGYGQDECIKNAVDGAMSQVNKIISAKGGAATR